ncbi:MAG: hypothetical protein AAF599_03380 [Bacteroidota bacterium]
MVVVMTAYWLLFAAREGVNYIPKKWRQYKERRVDKDIPVKDAPVACSDQKDEIVLKPSQVKQAAERLFLTFDRSNLQPKTSNKGKGRAKGTRLERRTRHPVVKKTQNKTKIKLKVEKKE